MKKPISRIWGAQKWLSKYYLWIVKMETGTHTYSERDVIFGCLV